MMKRIVDYKEMLYPQNEKLFAQTIPKEVFYQLKMEAFKNIQEGVGSDACKAHWKSIMDGKVPFGFRLVED